MPSTRTSYAYLTASFRACKACAFLDVFRQNESSIDSVIRVVNGLPVKLCDEDQRERPVDFGWCIAENIAQPDAQAVLLQSNSVIETGKRKELNLDFRERGPGAELTVRRCED